MVTGIYLYMDGIKFQRSPFVRRAWRHFTFFVHSQQQVIDWKELGSQCRSSCVILLHKLPQKEERLEYGLMDWVDKLPWKVMRCLQISYPFHDIVFDSVGHIAFWMDVMKSCTVWLKECFEKKERNHFYCALILHIAENLSNRVKYIGLHTNKWQWYN